MSPTTLERPLVEQDVVEQDVVEQDVVDRDLLDEDDELLIEEISIDGMCGVY